MKIPNQNCPVCNCSIQDGSEMFCPTCNWELISIPNTASQSLKNFYRKKIDLYKATFERTDKLNEEILAKEKLIEKLEKQNAELETRNKSLASDLTVQKPLLEKVKSLEQSIKGNEKQVKELTDNLEKEKDKLKKEKAAHEATKTKTGYYKFNPK